MGPRHEPSTIQIFERTPPQKIKKEKKMENDNKLSHHSDYKLLEPRIFSQRSKEIPGS